MLITLEECSLIPEAFSPIRSCGREHFHSDGKPTGVRVSVDSACAAFAHLLSHNIFVESALKRGGDFESGYAVPNCVGLCSKSGSIGDSHNAVSGAGRNQNGPTRIEQLYLPYEDSWPATRGPFSI